MWLKKKNYWKRDDRDTPLKAHEAIRKMHSRIKSLWPRTEGQNWNTAKFHEQQHGVNDMQNNGAPSGSNSGPPEHFFIDVVKKPSERTQKRRKVLDPQIG